MVERCSDDPLSSVAGLILTVPTVDSTVASMLWQVDEVSSHDRVYAPSSGAKYDGGNVSIRFLALSLLVVSTCGCDDGDAFRATITEVYVEGVVLPLF